MDIELDSAPGNFNKLGGFVICPDYLITKDYLVFDGALLLLSVVASIIGANSSPLLQVGFVGVGT